MTTRAGFSPSRSNKGDIRKLAVFRNERPLPNRCESILRRARADVDRERELITLGLRSFSAAPAASVLPG
jgi:hypothetical protein